MSGLTTCPVCGNEISYCDCVEHIPASGGTCPCAQCADKRYVAMCEARARVAAVPYVEVCHETAYGQTTRLPFMIRVF